MKKSLLIISLFFVAALFSCNNKKHEQEQKVREQQISDSFAQLMLSKDSEMQDLFQQLNEVDSSLSEVTSAYQSVSKMTNTSKELSRDTKASIQDKILLINTLLAKNKQKVANVNSKMKKEKKQNAQLQTFVNNLQTRIQEQEQQIQALNEELAKKNIQIEGLTKNVNDLTSRNQEKDNQILKIEEERAVAYYTIGTKKELVAKKLVDRTGGFIGIGKSTKVSSNADFSQLTKIDIRKTNEISLPGKKIQIISNHPSSSYTLEGNAQKPTSLRITNSSLFWRNTRCLVIMVK